MSPKLSIRRVKSELGRTLSDSSPDSSPLIEQASTQDGGPSQAGDLSHPRRKACIECQRRKIRCDGIKPACGPCVARGGEPCDFSLAERENRIASLQSKIKLLEQQLQRTDLGPPKPVDSNEFRADLWRRWSAVYLENGSHTRSLAPFLPLFPLPLALSARATPLPNASIHSSCLPSGYGFVLSRAELDRAIGTWKVGTDPSPALTLLLLRCFFPYRRTFHFFADPHALLARLSANDPLQTPLPALISVLLLAACRLIGGSAAPHEPVLLEKVRSELEYALAFADRLDDYLWASTVFGMYYGHTLRFLEAHSFYGATVRFALALGIHTDEPSEQMMATALTSTQRRQELRMLWHSIHVTDLWLTNAIGFTVATGPASAMPVEHMASFDAVYKILSVKPDDMAQSDPVEFRSRAYVAYCSIQSFCARYSLSRSGPNVRLAREATFWSEYGRYSTVLSALKTHLPSLDGTFGLSIHEVISPFNPDSLYLHIIIELCTLLLSDVLAQAGDANKYKDAICAARKIAKFARLIRSAGRQNGGDPAAATTHEIHVPFILYIPFFIVAEVFVRDLQRPVAEEAETMGPPPQPQPSSSVSPPPPNKTKALSPSLETLPPCSPSDHARSARDLETMIFIIVDMMRFYPQWVGGVCRMVEFLMAPEPAFLFI